MTGNVIPPKRGGWRLAGAALLTVAAVVAARPAAAVDRDRDSGDRDAASIRVELGIYGGTGGSFRPGEEVAFYVQTDQDGYLAVYNIDATGRVSLLFPRNADDDAWVEGNRRVRLPERGAGYGLYLGSDEGTEFVVAVASERRMDLERVFPRGDLAALDDIYDDEQLDREGLDRDDWVTEDPFLAMDVISGELAPDAVREDGFGEAYVTLQVGDVAGNYRSPRRVTVVNVYHHRYLYDPIWDPWWDPWYRPYYVGATWIDPWWNDPWCASRGYVVVGWRDPFWDPFWDPWWGCGSGVSVRATFGWWDDSWWHRHYGHSWNGPTAYWGSRVKWKTMPDAGVRNPSGTRWRAPSAQLASFTSPVGVQAPPVRVRLQEPLSPDRVVRTRAGDVRTREPNATPGGRVRGASPAAAGASRDARAAREARDIRQRERAAHREPEAVRERTPRERTPSAPRGESQGAVREEPRSRQPEREAVRERERTRERDRAVERQRDEGRVRQRDESGESSRSRAGSSDSARRRERESRSVSAARAAERGYRDRYGDRGAGDVYRDRSASRSNDGNRSYGNRSAERADRDRPGAGRIERQRQPGAARGGSPAAGARVRGGGGSRGEERRRR